MSLLLGSLARKALLLIWGRCQADQEPPAGEFLILMCHAQGVTLSREWPTAPNGGEVLLRLLGSECLTDSRAGFSSWLGRSILPEPRLGRLRWQLFSWGSLGWESPWLG